MSAAAADMAAPVADFFVGLDGLDEDQWQERLASLTEAEKAEIAAAVRRLPKCRPQPGPQTMAFKTMADVTGYGGAAGGGKTALLAMLGLIEHERSVIFRFDKTQLNGLIDDLVRFYGTQVGLNRQAGIFRFADRPGHLLEIGGLGAPGDETKWQGRAHDLAGFDEVTEIARNKVDYLKTWVRSATAGQRCRVVMTFNPPGSPGDESGAAGRWVIDFFAPWLDERHPNPAEPGELRWFGQDENGEDVEIAAGEPGHNGELYTIEVEGRALEVRPESRTFIPARVWDNAYLMQDPQYVSRLNALTPLNRRRMLLGDFRSGLVDADNQVIPSAWVEEAMDRWEREIGGRDVDLGPMDALGIDVARGGRANTVWAPRHGFTWARLARKPGTETPDGDSVAGPALLMVRSGAKICVDSNGPGSSAYDRLNSLYPRVVQCVGQASAGDLQRYHHEILLNLRAALWLTMRKVLDPANGFMVRLPKDNILRSELLAARKFERAGKVLIEDKDEIKKRLGFSTDSADAVIQTLMNIMSTFGSERMIPRTSYVLANQVTAAAAPAGSWMAN